MFSSLLGKITHSSPLFICYIFCLGRCKSETTSSSDSAAELGIDNVGGVFVVLGSGCFMALIIGVLEFLWNVRKVAVDERVSFHLNFSPFLQFFLACPSCASALHLLCFIKLFFCTHAFPQESFLLSLIRQFVYFSLANFCKQIIPFLPLPQLLTVRKDSRKSHTLDTVIYQLFTQMIYLCITFTRQTPREFRGNLGEEKPAWEKYSEGVQRKRKQSKIHLESNFMWIPWR